MMTSTFPTTRSYGHNLKYGIRELQHKKEILLNLEAAVKKKVNEFRQLCLKEGELTGHLPADYPLQPREPIPQVRRRITRSNGNIPSELHSSLSNGSLTPPPTSLTSLHKTSEQVSHQHHPATFALPTAKILTHPSRSTSTTSSNSTALSSLNKQLLSATKSTNLPTSMTTNLMHSSEREIHRISNFNDEINQLKDNHNFNNKQPTEHTAAIMLQRRQKQLQQQRQQQHQQIMNKQYDQLFTLPDHFKKPFTLRNSANPNFDSDSLGNIRASSTASSSSSSGSAASSTVSAFASIPCQQSQQRYADTNLHVRSCSESVPNDGRLLETLAMPTLAASQTSFNPHNDQLMIHPMRPPKGAHSQTSRARTIKSNDTQSLDGNINGLMGSVIVGSTENSIEEKHNLNIVNHFQPYYEETKPFQMSDFYKYSAKHGQRATSPEPVEPVRTTRQLQDEIATMKQPLKLTACDDQILASRKLIERSGQKFMNATAKAIACNPSLADRLNNLIPNRHGEGY